MSAGILNPYYWLSDQIGLANCIHSFLSVHQSILPDIIKNVSVSCSFFILFCVITVGGE